MVDDEDGWGVGSNTKRDGDKEVGSGEAAVGDENGCVVGSLLRVLVDSDDGKIVRTDGIDVGVDDGRPLI
jgi:hypothetical protein